MYLVSSMEHNVFSVQAVMAQLPVEQQARLAKKAEELSLEQEK